MGYVNVKALQPFYGTEEGKVAINNVFPLTETYAKDLERKGLVEIQGIAQDPAAKVVPDPVGAQRAEVVVEPDVKKRPAPNNKMAPALENKAL